MKKSKLCLVHYPDGEDMILFSCGMVRNCSLTDGMKKGKERIISIGGDRSKESYRKHN